MGKRAKKPNKCGICNTNVVVGEFTCALVATPTGRSKIIKVCPKCK